MSDVHNEGIIISGGTVSGQVVNRSAGSVVSQGTPATADTPTAAILARLDELEQLLGQHQEQISGYDAAKRDVADLRDEAARPDRDSGRIADTLRRLTARVGTVTVLASAADKLAEAVRALF